MNIPHPICALTLQFTLIHSRHYARQARRREATGLLSCGVRPRESRGRSLLFIPGSKTPRREAVRLMSQRARPREIRAVEVEAPTDTEAVVRLGLLRPVFFGLQPGRTAWRHLCGAGSACI
jgi:hypothetical protein